MNAASLDFRHADWFLSGAGLVGCVLALIGAVGERPAAPPAGAARIGHVESQVNTVRRRVDGTLVWNRIDRNDALFESDAVFADEGSAARLVLDDGSWIEVGPKTLVVVERTRAGKGDGSLSIELVRGSLQAGSGSAPMAIRSGTGSVGMDGSSQVSLRKDPNGDGAVQVVAGTAKIDGKSGSVGLTAGDRSRIGKAPPKAERSTITLESPATGARIVTEEASVTVAFRWRGPGSGRWGLELARDAFFRDRVLTVPTETGAHAMPLPPGIYYWRVRRGAQVSDERQFIVAEAVRPVVFQPRLGESIYQPPGKESPVAFAWTSVPDAAAYSLEVRREGSAVVQQEVPRTAWIHAGGLADGRHCARVRVSGDGEWSAETCFQVVAGSRLPPPRLVPE